MGKITVAAASSWRELFEGHPGLAVTPENHDRLLAEQEAPAEAPEPAQEPPEPAEAPEVPDAAPEAPAPAPRPVPPRRAASSDGAP